MEPARTFIVLACALALVACGPKDPKTLIAEGNLALGSGESEIALAKFRAAVKLLDASDELYKDARIAVVEALIASNPEQAFLEMARLSWEMPERIGERDLAYMCQRMISARRYNEAANLVRTGIECFGAGWPAKQTLLARIKREEAATMSGRHALEPFPCTFD